MNGNLKYQASAYMGSVAEASSRAPGYAVAVGLGWLACPFAIATLAHPQDALWAQYKLQGLRVPHGFTAQQLTVGFVEAAVALAVLVLLQLVGTVLFYREAKMSGAEVATPLLWPLALFVTGILGNAAWFFGTGAFDLGGCIIGLSSTALTVVAEMICNTLGREFVCGPGPAAQAPLLAGPAMSPGPVWSARPAGPVVYHIPE